MKKLMLALAFIVVAVSAHAAASSVVDGYGAQVKDGFGVVIQTGIQP
jgi:hypothetical protein